MKVSPRLGGNVGTTKGVTCSLELEACNFINGTLLLNMRDGPRGRAPAIRFATVYGLVTLTKNPSVALCVSSATSVVNVNTTDKQTSTGHNRVNNKDNPLVLHSKRLYAGGEYFDLKERKMNKN
jgi:hypothetical protein